uniref:Protein DOG1-like 4 n=1 Tax=Elaeis guineensis var. tenera TaxID=51953 RepID=A0A6J0PAJ7_ELAGV|nr:protein DOG1-like 4 [Elaeis guineensis]
MEAFFDAWIAGLEELQNELLSAPRDRPDLLRPLVARALNHYQDYYHEKARLAARDVLRVFSPRWLTPFERSFHWIAGWKPSLAFRLLLSIAMALSQVLAVARRVRDGEARGQAAEMVVRSLELLLASADALRTRTVTCLVDILTPAQSVDFLLAAAQLRLRVRRWGMRRYGRTSD